MTQYNSEYDGMGGTLIMCVLIVAGVIFALKHSERKSKSNAASTQQAVIEQQVQQQKAIANKFQNQHSNGPFDHTDYALAGQVVDYVKNAGNNPDAIPNIAGVFGNLRRNTAEEAAKRAAQEMMNRFKSQVDQKPAPEPVPVQPPEIRYIEKPVYIDPRTGREISANGNYGQPAPGNGNENGRFSRVNNFDHYS